MVKRFCLVMLWMAALAAAQQLTFMPFHSSGIYALGEKAGWTVALAPVPAPRLPPTPTSSNGKWSRSTSKRR